MTDSIELAFKNLRIEELECMVLHAHQQFRNVIAHVRCYLCGEPIDDQRWHLGEVGEAQEIVHTECFDQNKKAEEGASEEDAVRLCQEALFEGWAEAHNHSNRGGEPVRAPKTNPCADVLGGSTLEAFASSEGLGTYAREHGDVGGEPDAQGSWSPAHVAGCGGPVEVRVPERLIPFTGINDVTVRVPKTLKAQLKEIVRSNFPHPDPERHAYDVLARALKDKGIK